LNMGAYAERAVNPVVELTLPRFGVAVYTQRPKARIRIARGTFMVPLLKVME
jgi:tRNA(Ser,Leu) C12 N-acetylase TAN1